MVDSRLVGRGYGFAHRRSKPSGLIDECAEDVEDDDLDVTDPGHVPRLSRCSPSPPER
ncbi:hypothetical protein STAFG_9022 [Streptomyces afghaniensis 772]|uniref:Uncharacterized protein n=1 Tax=Streptomyces afghaniensis 772 TaxID=1283301 RepID=S4N8W4_9ACTN|nr:hypothetical protein STAFG_9022 [Streptomyces afghaniensis 772]